MSCTLLTDNLLWLIPVFLYSGVYNLGLRNGHSNSAVFFFPVVVVDMSCIMYYLQCIAEMQCAKFLFLALPCDLPRDFLFYLPHVTQHVTCRAIYDVICSFRCGNDEGVMEFAELIKISRVDNVRYRY